jgi:excisionase family DNA binding protein
MHSNTPTRPALLLTPEQAAEALAISPRKLWDMKASGSIKYVRCGRCIRYHIDDLRVWIEENKEVRSDGI